MEENYPAHLETTLKLHSGGNVRFRPVKPEDETAMQDFFYSLSERAVYHRFFAHLKFFPLSFLRRFTHIDYRTQMTVVCTADEEGHDGIIAVGHYVVNGETNLGEPAMIVRDDWQQRGVGTLLFSYLIKTAKGSGLAGFTAEVLKDNLQMIRLLEKAGFTLSPGFGRSSITAELRFAATQKGIPGNS